MEILAEVVREYALRARVVALGAQLAAAAAALAPRALVLCDRAFDFSELAGLRADFLGPPPCRDGETCPFEPYRLVKFVNARSLTRFPTAVRVLTRLWLDAGEYRDLVTSATRDGPEAAAAAYLGAHPQMVPAGEVRTAVLLPANASRQAFDVAELVAAATLAEEELAAAQLPRAARFKAELVNDGCAAPLALKYLTDALGTGEYGALSAVAGPACGAAFADVARLSPAHVLPVLAYTAQAAPAAAPALLAAGDARRAAAALAALLARHGWRRLAVLSEPGTRALRAALDVAAPPPDVLVHAELPDAPTSLRQQVISQVWWCSVSMVHRNEILNHSSLVVCLSRDLLIQQSVY